MKMLDIRIAGIHFLCYEYGTIEENTHGMVAISNLFYSYYQSPEGQPMVGAFLLMEMGYSDFKEH